MPNRHAVSIALLVLASVVAPLAAQVRAANDTAPPSSVAITLPTAGSTVVNTRLEITGTAPAAVLVAVSIVDIDISAAGADSAGKSVDGSVTSDADGEWAFVAQSTLPAGNFEVRASYTADNQAIQSTAVKFVVVNEGGTSSAPSLLMIGVAVAAIVAGVVLYRKWRQGWRPLASLVDHAARSVPADRRRQTHPNSHSETRRESQPESQALFMNTVEGRNYQRRQAERIQDMDDEMKAIARALADTAESLERSNSTIAALRHRIADELRDNPTEPPADV